jgi:hypothetical protein
VKDVDGLLEKYAGKEEALFKALTKKYGPEPEPSGDNGGGDDDDDEEDDDEEEEEEKPKKAQGQKEAPAEKPQKLSYEESLRIIFKERLVAFYK